MTRPSAEHQGVLRPDSPVPDVLDRRRSTEDRELPTRAEVVVMPLGRESRLARRVEPVAQSLPLLLPVIQLCRRDSTDSDGAHDHLDELALRELGGERVRVRELCHDASLVPAPIIPRCGPVTRAERAGSPRERKVRVASDRRCEPHRVFSCGRPRLPKPTGTEIVSAGKENDSDVAARRVVVDDLAGGDLKSVDAHLPLLDFLDTDSD